MTTDGPGTSTTAQPPRRPMRVSIDRQLLHLLRAVAGVYDLSLGELVEDIVLCAFLFRLPLPPDSREHLERLAKLAGVDLTKLAREYFSPAAYVLRGPAPEFGAKS
jgi:hypothetical protein